MRSNKAVLAASFAVAALVVCLFFAPAHADIVGGDCGAGDDPASVKWSLNTDTGVLTVSGNGAIMANTAFNLVGWLNYSSVVKEVVVSQGVTAVGHYAFSGLSNMTKITMADSVLVLGNNAVEYNRSLVDLQLPKDLNFIGDSCFDNCVALETIEIPSGVERIEKYTFNNCKKLKNVSLPNGLTYICTGAFGYCSSLQSISIPSSVLGIANSAFIECGNLRKVVLQPGLQNIGSQAFESCVGLTSVVFPVTVQYIGDGAFKGCSALTTIEFLGDAPPRTVGTDAFGSQLTKAIVPKGALAAYKAALAGKLPAGTEIVERVETTYALSQTPAGSAYTFQAKRAPYAGKAPRTFKITNTGTGPITNLYASIGGQDAAAFHFSKALQKTKISASPDGGITLNSASVAVGPVDGLPPGTYSATLTLGGTGGGAVVNATWTLSFTVQEPLPPQIKASPTQRTFATRTVGYKIGTSATIAVKNTGATPVEGLASVIRNESVAGGAEPTLGTPSPYDPTPFFRFADDSPPLPSTLAPGQSAYVKIRPVEGLAAGQYYATLWFETDDRVVVSVRLAFTVVPKQ